MRFLIVFCFFTTVVLAQTNEDIRYVLSKSCFNSSFDDFGVRRIAGRYFMISASVDADRSIYKDPITGRPFTDLYELKECTKIDAYLKNEPLGQEILLSSPQNDGNISGDMFGKVIFFSSNYFDSLGGKSGLFYVKRLKNGWSNPYFFPFNSREYDVIHPCFDPYANQLYFSSNLPGGKGGFDLYSISFDGKSFGKPVAISGVNSEHNEVFPSVREKTLYFSSNRKGVGGLDVYGFVDGQVNLLPKEVNTPYDDFDYYPMGSNTGFLSSNREQQGKNDEVYFVTNTQVPLHVLDLDDEEKIIQEITQNISLYSQLNSTPVIQQKLTELKGNRSKVEGYLNQLQTLNLSLNEFIPTFLSTLVQELVHTSKSDLDTKDQWVLALVVQFQTLSTTHDSVSFTIAREKLLSVLDAINPTARVTYETSLGSMLKDGLTRISLMKLTEQHIDQLLEKNEGLYFTAISEKSEGISDEQWNRLAKTQAGLTQQLALLDEKRKLDELQRKLTEQSKQMELLMAEFQATLMQDRWSEFSAIDSLFMLFKSNPTEENTLKLMEALQKFNPSVIEEMRTKLQASITQRDALTRTKDSLEILASKFNEQYIQDYTSLTTSIRKGETIGAKDELERMKQEYGINFTATAQKILDNNVFSEQDLTSKFSSVGNILFDFDSYTLTKMAKAQLDSVIVLFLQQPNTKLLLNGYTDNTGRASYNLKLSKKRAASVFRYLTKHGVPRKALVLFYHGEKFPSVENATREGRKLNRRVELKFQVN
jgi:outer membrane protein OmpA-like peptidoglycan-associated protein